METIELASKLYYIPNTTNIGLIDDCGNGVFIDSGIDGDVSRKAAMLAEEMGIRPSMVINTHSHADHCGGKTYLTSTGYLSILTLMQRNGHLNG